MIKKSFILMLTGILINMSFPNLSDASLGSLPDTHTHTNALELKPASLSNSYQTASVCFLGVGDCVSGDFAKGDDDMSVDTSKQCLNEGFVRNNCNSVQEADGICPYNSSYIKGCKCKTGLITCPDGQVGSGDSCGGKYATCQCSPALVSCPSNKNGQGASCGGKYQSCVCKPEYQYNSSNCTSPRSVSGANCDGKYTGCSCPTGVSTGAYGCKEYYPAPCGSVCKIAYSDNCHIRTAVSTPYGCMSYFSDCPSKCERAYSDNCRNRTEVYAPHGCQQAWGDCSSKCQIPYGDNCRNRTAVSTPYGCLQYFADCTSKCQIAQPNPDCNVTSQSCTYGCASTNSCGKCTSCKPNPDCSVTSQFCAYGCASTNSCGKCTSCKGCNFLTECPGATVPGPSKCQCGGTPCTACGITKYKCNKHCIPELACDGVRMTCGGKSCCCPTGQCYNSRGQNICSCDTSMM